MERHLFCTSFGDYHETSRLFNYTQMNAGHILNKGAQDTGLGKCEVSFWMVTGNWLVRISTQVTKIPRFIFTEKLAQSHLDGKCN